jgi:signal transduction histidine kinase
MSERSDGIRRGGSMRDRARLVQARKRSLHLSGLSALGLAVAGSGAALAGLPDAPSLAFVLQCLALGVIALLAPAQRPLRRAVPALAIAVTAALLLVVALDIALQGSTLLPLEIAAATILLPTLGAQLAGRLQRALAIVGGAVLLLAAAAVSGMEVSGLLHFALALGFVAGVSLVAGHAVAVARAARVKRHDELRRSMLAERRRTRAREEMVANLSHDLRNPLAVALGFAEMAEDELLPADDRAQALSGLRRSLWEMSQLVENVLDGSAEQAGALTPALEPVELAPLCDDALAATRVLLRRRPIELSCAIERGVVVLADRQRLVRVLGNLLGNACKYTVVGQISLEAAACGAHATIRVRDTGPGIAPDALPHIFDRFRRGHHGGPAGAGLGLAIAHRLAERMGGRLEVESELGVGSTFILTLPLVAAERREPVAA